MSMDDIMVCIDESKKDDDGTNLEDLSDDQSSDAAAGELDEKDIAEMNALVGNVLDSGTDPETDDKVDEEMKEETKIEVEEEMKQEEETK